MSRGAQGTFGAAKVLCVRGLRWPHALRRWSEPLGRSAPSQGGPLLETAGFCYAASQLGLRILTDGRTDGTKA